MILENSLSEKTQQLIMITNIFTKLIEKYKNNNRILIVLRTVLRDSRQEVQTLLKNELSADINARDYLNKLYEKIYVSEFE